VEVFSYFIWKAEPQFWKRLSHKVQDYANEMFFRWIVPIMGDAAVYDGPEPLDGIELRVIGRQLDRMNATIFARQECSNIEAFVVLDNVSNDHALNI
jgi:hypothetical protein